MKQRGLGSNLSIKTLIRATFFAISLATITPVAQAIECGAPHKTDHHVAYYNTNQGTKDGALA